MPGSIRHDGKAGTGCSSSSNRQKFFDDQAARASLVDGAPNPVTAHLLAHSLSPYCFVHTPQPPEVKPTSDEEIVTTGVVVPKSFAMTSLRFPEKPDSLSQ